MLLDAGFVIFNPLTHSHPLDKLQKRDPEFWYDFDLKFLNKCNGIIMSPGWGSSKGCILELKRAKDLIKKGILFEILYYEELVKNGKVG